MSETRRIKLSVDTMVMMIWRDIIPDTGVYDIVISSLLIMDDPYAHVLE